MHGAVPRGLAARGSIVACVALAACGADAPTGGSQNDSDAGSTVADAGTMTLESSAFPDGGTLPVDATCDGAGKSPPLAWTGAPAGTVELAVLMTTLAKDGLKWNWVLYRVPGSVTALPEDDAEIGQAGLTSDGPELAYSPPCSQGPGAKTYTFTVYALSAAPTFSVPANQVTGKLLTDAIGPLTLAHGQLDVSYTRAGSGP